MKADLRQTNDYCASFNQVGSNYYIYVYYVDQLQKENYHFSLILKMSLGTNVKLYVLSSSEGKDVLKYFNACIVDFNSFLATIWYFKAQFNLMLSIKNLKYNF